MRVHQLIVYVKVIHLTMFIERQLVLCHTIRCQPKKMQKKFNDKLEQNDRQEPWDQRLPWDHCFHPCKHNKIN